MALDVTAHKPVTLMGLCNSTVLSLCEQLKLIKLDLKVLLTTGERRYETIRTARDYLKSRSGCEGNSKCM